MKSGWEALRLGDICTLLNGRAYKQKELLTTGKYPVLRVGNFFTNRSWYYSDLELEDDKYCDEGDLLYAWSASFGPRVWHGPKAIFHYHIWKVRIDAARADKRFLLHWFDWDKERITTEQGAGTTMIHVTKGSMEDRQILVPPLPEQRRIVAILDEAFEGIAAAKANAEKNLRNAKELFESIVSSAVTQPSPKWLNTVLGTLAVVDWGNTGLTKKVYANDGKYLAVSAAGCDGRIGHAEHKAFTPVLSAIGAQCGKMFLPEEDFTAIKNTITLTPNPHLCDGWFLFYLLGAKTLPKRGAAQPFIAKGDVVSFPVTVPALEDQRTIAARLREMQPSTVDLDSTVSAKVTALHELKASLLHQAFTGQL